MRADKWLWQARFFRTRGVAGEVVAAGGLRINGARMTKPAGRVRPGDALSFVQAGRVRVVRIRALPHRRGPPVEAATLYDDLDGPKAGAAGEATPGAGER